VRRLVLWGLRHGIVRDPDLEHRLVMASIRNDLAALGFPVDDLSDEQLEAGVQEFARITAAAGVTADQAMAALTAVTKAIAAAP
jgi:hypothetical protein